MVTKYITREGTICHRPHNRQTEIPALLGSLKTPRLSQFWAQKRTISPRISVKT